jgi:hypothetical protein
MSLISRFFLLSISVVCGFSLSLPAEEENFYQKYRYSAISSAAGTPWSAEQHLRLVQQANAFREELAHQFKQKAYPISEEDLKEIYQNAESDRILFFAYSSMIDKESAAVKAISAESAATQAPAIAFGIQRTFNRELPAETVEKGWGPLKRYNDLAILNVFDKEDSVLNGVIFSLPLSDLLVLSKREVGYNLIPVVVMLWENACNEEANHEMFIAYTFQAPDYTGEGTHFTNSHINPIPGYFHFLQNGLNLFGSDFTAMWWATTFLSDQATLVKELPYQDPRLKSS